MASSSSSSSYSLLLFLSLLLLPYITSSNIITIPISHLPKNPHPDPYQHLSYLANSSLKRAHHLKNPQTTPPHTNTEIPFFSHSYGGYSIPLSFGTPPQTLPFMMDTGSDLTWFPCGKNYQCINCSTYLNNTAEVKSFIPNLSSSSEPLACLNPKCAMVYPKIHCPDCKLGSKNCTRRCPWYTYPYGSGDTSGSLLSETLHLPNRRVPDFLVGCSIRASDQPAAGIAGLGRGPASLPTQLAVKKFSYCLLSRLFDDTNKSSSLVLVGGKDSVKKTKGISYTPFVKNPEVPGKGAFLTYYYVGLSRITVGGRRVKIPYRYLRPDKNGSGGTIVDSGTTFTHMAPEVFELVAGEFEKLMKGYKRAEEVEALTRLRPCYNVSGIETPMFPSVTFHFKGGAEMALPEENYMAPAGWKVLCLTIRGDNLPVISSGPSIILGSFQMQNYHVEYDLQNERFGFKQQQCN
ncbi:probable aspartyl protease At4g16563 [Prunus avium]|nr:probable aspartyl protease At4g16563 [Prunus avium]